MCVVSVTLSLFLRKNNGVIRFNVVGNLNMKHLIFAFLSANMKPFLYEFTPWNFSPSRLRACLHGGGGPQVGEVTRFGG